MRRRLLRLVGWLRLMPSHAAVLRSLASTLKQRGRPQHMCVRRRMGRDAFIVRPTRNSRAQSEQLKWTRPTVGEAHDACYEAATSRLSLRWGPRSAPECELVGSAGLWRSTALDVRDAGRVASARLRWRPLTGTGAPGRATARLHEVGDVDARDVAIPALASTSTLSSRTQMRSWSRPDRLRAARVPVNKGSRARRTVAPPTAAGAALAAREEGLPLPQRRAPNTVSMPPDHGDDEVDDEEEAPPSTAPLRVSPTQAHLPSAGSRAGPDVDGGHSGEGRDGRARGGSSPAFITVPPEWEAAKKLEENLLLARRSATLCATVCVTT